jgi:hypothetical protein
MVNVDRLTKPATAADPDTRGDRVGGHEGPNAPATIVFLGRPKGYWSERSASWWPCSHWSRQTWRRTTRRSLTIFRSGLSGRQAVVAGARGELAQAAPAAFEVHAHRSLAFSR